MKRLLPLFATALLVNCGQEPAPVDTTTETEAATEAPTYEILVDRFADVEVLRYEVPGFDELSLKQKKLVY
jgi:dipeptidyl-peptidase-3